MSESVEKDFSKYLDGAYQFYKPKGCEKCMHTGYAGREMVSEVLVIDDHLSSMIAQEASKEDMLQYALDNGFVTMFQDAAIRAAGGKTSIEEVYRVAKG